MPGLIDRYIIKMFATVLGITFTSLAGLFILIDLSNNPDEFIAYSSEDGPIVFLQYYGPRTLQFFDRTGSVIVLLAAIFAITTLMKTNELVAIMAAGVSKGRVLQPLIYSAVLVALLGVVNREVWIPAVRPNLVRNAQDWRGQRANPLRPTYDYRTDIFIGGRHTVAQNRTIMQPQFRLPAAFASFGSQIVAELATYHDRTGDRPAGYLMHNVSIPSDLPKIASGKLNADTIILSPADHPDLLPNQCFVVSDVTFDQLAGGNVYRALSSSWELMAALRNPSLDLGNDTRVALHARMVQPLLDMSLFVLGLPLVIRRDQRNVFVAAGMCLALVAVFLVTVIICHTLGASFFMPALGAWLPLMIFAPAAYTTSAPLWR